MLLKIRLLILNYKTKKVIKRLQGKIKNGQKVEFYWIS